MKYPFISNIRESKELTNAFSGYVHTLTVPDGAFFDLKNITTENYPVMTPRHKRGFVKDLVNPQGMIDKDGLIIVDDGRLYIDGVDAGISLSNVGKKSITKMGAYIVIFPDKVWYNTKDKTSGNIEALFETTASVSLSLVNSNGQAITWHDADYYKSHTANEGDYMMSTVNGKTSLKVYSSATGLWASVATTYFKIQASGLGARFEKGDGVKITINASGWDYAKNIFVNEEGGKRNSNFAIFDKSNDYITVPGLLDANRTLSGIKIERKAPDMAFVTECMNRLWGCSTDGHEIYCCKLGDVKNWNCFAGISTDSWAATVGTDGVFTGAFSYMGYPIFFKEDSLIRVNISSQGAHQTRDIACRGVQKGSEQSLCMVNEALYYKSTKDVCVYDGQFPQTISEALGDENYKNAVGGCVGNRYYLSMEGEDGKISNFVYSKGLWSKEDDLKIDFYAKSKDNLYFIANKKLYSVYGDTEGEISWMAETGKLGFTRSNSADKNISTKDVSRINIRMSLGLKSHVSLYIEYDSADNWEHVWQMYGKGTKLFTIPVKPHMCDHFRLKLVGKGDAVIQSITTSFVEGSDT